MYTDMTDDVPVIWEQNCGFPSLQAHPIKALLANLPMTRVHVTDSDVL